MKKWVRLYRAEEGSFAQLPLFARALAAELLKVADDDGVIQLGRKAPVDALAFALGATRGDRRMLATLLPLLLDDGYLEHRGTTLLIPNFPLFQSDDAAAVRTRARRDASTSAPRQVRESTMAEPRTDREASASEPRRGHDGAAKSSASAGNDSLARSVLSSEEKRIEEKGSDSERVVRDPMLGLMPDAPSETGDGLSLRDVVEVLGVFQAAAGRDFGLMPHPNRERTRQLLLAARDRHAHAPLEAIREAAKAWCEANDLDALKHPYAAFCAQPWHVARSGGRRTRVVAPDPEYREDLGEFGDPEEERSYA